MKITPEIKLSLDEISAALGVVGRYNVNAEISGIATNSKEVIPGDIFIALPGENTNGEKYVADAKARGAYIISSEYAYAEFLVTDTYEALLDIASYYKSKLPYLQKTVAITGSVGKTTTKNILRDTLSTRFRVHATKENYNNYLGLFHTVLTTPKNTEILIAELGMNHVGEIRRLSKALTPDISIITNVGTAHIGNLGTREAIAKAKLEILDGMNTPCIILPHEEHLLSEVDGRHTVSIENTDADSCVIAKKLEKTHSKVDILTPCGKIYSKTIYLPGRHILYAIAYSVEVMVLLGVNIKNIAEALSAVNSSASRGKFINVGNVTVYDDTYSSSFEAVIADFEFFSLFNKRRRACVIGDMLELGEHSKKLHVSVGAMAAKYGFEKIFAFGRFANDVAEGALSGGMSKSQIFINENSKNHEYTAKQIEDNCKSGELILIKASHALHADRIIDILDKNIN